MVRGRKRTRATIGFILTVLLAAPLVGAAGGLVPSDRPVPAGDLLAPVLHPASPSGEAEPAQGPLASSVDAECIAVGAEPGNQVTCTDSWWQSNEGRIRVDWHVGFHTMTADAGVSGRINLIWWAPDGHKLFHYRCFPRGAGDLHGNLRSARSPVFCFTMEDSDHYHVGTNTLEVRAKVRPRADPVDGCPWAQTTGQDTCAGHGWVETADFLSP